MITPENFKCDRKCADCCKYLTVKLLKREIKAIEREGYEDFYEWDNHIGSNVVRMDDGCFFLGKKDGKYYCKIYRIRPSVCRKYPFVNKDNIESCKPALLKY